MRGLNNPQIIITKSGIKMYVQGTTQGKKYLQVFKYHIDLNFKYLEIIKISSNHVLKAL